jgi:hypothetical protein
MKMREVIRLLAEEDPEAEVMVSVDMRLSRSHPHEGTLILPTRCIEVGRFGSGEMTGRPWIAIVATDAWGISPKAVETPHEEWCVICKREPLAHTDEEYRACMAACGKYEGGEYPSLETVAEQRKQGQRR